MQTSAPSTERPERYRPRDPVDSVLVQLVRDHARSFIDKLRTAGADHPFVPIIEREFAAIAACGDLTRGFCRLECPSCKAPRVVALSCKSRLCSSCAGRRMAEQAAYWTDRLLPAVPWRQWTLTFPWDLRRVMAFDAELTSHVLWLAMDSIGRWQRERATASGARQPRSGSLVQIQRFGDAATLNVHIHALLPDGVFDAGHSPPRFVPVAPPSQAQLAALLATIDSRIQAWLERHGPARFRDAGDDSGESDTSAACLLPLAAPTTTTRPPARPKTATNAATRRPLPRDERLATTPRGYSLHIAARIPPTARKRLERVAKYLARPPVAEERLRWLPDGNLAVDLKRTWRGGVTELHFTPEQFLARLAMLLPPPGFHLTRFYGFLAPASAIRKWVVPRPPDPQKTGVPTAPPRPKKMLWADLLWRSFRVDGLRCECGSRMRLIAVILKPTVAEAICASLIASGHLDSKRVRPHRPRPPPRETTVQGARLVPLPDIA